MTDVEFLKFAGAFIAFCILLAMVELTFKGKPINAQNPDYKNAYELPPGLEDLVRRNGQWIHEKTEKPATKQEVQDAGLVWAGGAGENTPQGVDSKKTL